jgi:hypothetical protein
MLKFSGTACIIDQWQSGHTPDHERRSK